MPATIAKLPFPKAVSYSVSIFLPKASLAPNRLLGEPPYNANHGANGWCRFNEQDFRCRCPSRTRRNRNRCRRRRLMCIGHTRCW